MKYKNTKYYVDYFEDIPENKYKYTLPIDLRKRVSHYDYLRIVITAININTQEKIIFKSVKEAEKYFKGYRKTFKKCSINNTLYKNKWKIIYDK